MYTATADDVIVSKRLSWLLRHGLMELSSRSDQPQAEQKPTEGGGEGASGGVRKGGSPRIQVFRGGWVNVDDLLKLPLFRRFSKADILRVIDHSKSTLFPNRSRFEICTRSSFIINNGIINNSDGGGDNNTLNAQQQQQQQAQCHYCRATYGLTVDVSEFPALSSAPPVDPLVEFCIECVASNIKSYASCLADELPDSYLLLRLFTHLKAAKKLNNAVIRLFACEQMEMLDLSGLFIGDTLLRSISNACPQLQVLNMKGNYTIMTDSNIEYLVRRCTHIHTLVLEECKYVTNRGVSLIAQHLKELRHINLAFLPAISEESLSTLAALYTEQRTRAHCITADNNNNNNNNNGEDCGLTDEAPILASVDIRGAGDSRITQKSLNLFRDQCPDVLLQPTSVESYY